MLLVRNHALYSDAAPNYQIYVRSPEGSSTSSLKHHGETDIIKTTNGTKQRLNDDLTPVHKKTTNRTTTSPITDNNSQAPTV